MLNLKHLIYNWLSANYEYLYFIFKTLPSNQPDVYVDFLSLYIRQFWTRFWLKIGGNKPVIRVALGNHGKRFSDAIANLAGQEANITWTGSRTLEIVIFMIW